MKKSQQILYLILIIATLLDILLLAYIVIFPVDSFLKHCIEAFDLILCIVLWLEFIYSYLHSDNKKQYMKDNSLSILGMLPLNFVFLRALRLIKLFQLIRVFVLARETGGYITKFLKETYLGKIIFLSIIFIFVVTVSINFLDPGINGIKTSFWYIMVSMTSTGYGDIVPVSNLGRTIGIISMIGGILIFATITAVISSVYVSKINREHHDNLECQIEDLTSEIEKLNKKMDELIKDKKEE